MLSDFKTDERFHVEAAGLEYEVTRETRTVISTFGRVVDKLTASDR